MRRWFFKTRGAADSLAAVIIVPGLARVWPALCCWALFCACRLAGSRMLRNAWHAA